MKAISLRQPWAGLIAAGIKTIETRTWSTNYRGELLIHAAKKIDRDAVDVLKHIFDINDLPDICEVQGAILCKVTLVTCVEWKLIHSDKSYCDAFGGFAWILEDIVPFKKPIPWRGQQGFFNVELKP